MAAPPIVGLSISDPKQNKEKKGNDFIKNEPSNISATFLSKVFLELYTISINEGIVGRKWEITVRDL